MAEKTVQTTNSNDKSLTNREGTRNPEFFTSPPVDIFERAEGLTVVADLPGVTHEGLNIRVENNLLTIEGRMGHTFRSDPIDREFEPVNFFRQFELAETVDQEKISAELKQGVLTLTLPQKEATKPRQISVTVS